MGDSTATALPEVVGAWHGWEGGLAAKGRVADAIIYYVAVTEGLCQWPMGQVLSYADLVGERLSMGMDAVAYGDALSSLKPLVGPKASRVSLERAIEFAELLVDQLCPDASAREEFLSSIAGRASGMYGKFDEGALATFEAICRSLGLGELAMAVRPRSAVLAGHAAEGGGPRFAASGARRSCPRVGAYTLEQAAGQRFKEIAEQLHRVEVVLNHDLVETTALREMGRHTDVVIVVTRCAKHAATDAIRRHVDKEQIVYADGRGSSSMLRALQTYLQRVE